MYSQDINQTDASGKRHGYWEKHYPGTTQLRYTGSFHHGKEKGRFKFYCETYGKTPNVIIDYGKGSIIAKVTYADSTGTLISEGNIKDKKTD